ncbi:MAG: DNA invertase Pin-like site-specific DNA recombinase [Motiliproteus sp.]|jgi:DNA invertase Pin-like site-specific DNA recombinase
MDYIYSRVSTADQNATQQAEHLSQRYPNAGTVTECFTGTTTDRPKFQELLRTLVEGDSLIVFEVSRVGRKTQEVLDVAQDLKRRGIRLVVDQLGGIDVTSPAGEMVLTVMAGLAKMEREQMLERQRIGIERAKAEGKYKGRSAVSAETIVTAKRLIEDGSSVPAAAKQLKMGASTLYRLLKDSKS